MYFHTLIHILMLFLASFVTATPTTYGPVGQESLHDIALQYSENSEYTVEQWAVGIWQSNPRSFANQNLFAILPNSIIQIPEQETIQNISQEVALATIQNQLQHWQALFQQDSTTSSIPAPHVAFKNQPQELESSLDYTQPQKVHHKSTLLDRFLLSFLRGSHYLQHHMQVISATVFSKQVIPMLIITAGSGLLICTIWFAYTSSKRERRQQHRPSQSLAAIGSNTGNALSLQDNEDASDFNVFTTKEGAPIKLDLARAYITMRDLAGARSLLEEIIDLHPGKIASEAKHMLAEIT